MVKCRRMKRLQCTSKNWIYSWLWKSSRTRQQYCRSESSVDVGQYFITKDIEEFSQFTDSVVCREYTFPKRWKINWPERLDSREHQHWAASVRKHENGEEIRNESVNTDSSHSWVWISNGLNKLVTDLIDKEDDDNAQDASEIKFEEFALETHVFVFASRSKVKAKPRRSVFAGSSTRIVPICERFWADIEPGIIRMSLSVSKRLSILFRHGDPPREEDGAIEFWRLKRLCSDRVWEFSALVWWNVEEQNDKKRRKQ